MSHVFQGVQAHKLGFELCLRMHDDPSCDTPDITDKVDEILGDPFFFSTNLFVLSIFKPAVDALGKLENENSNLGDVWVAFIICRLEMQKVPAPTHFQVWKDYCLGIVGVWAMKCCDPIYIVAFFLNPRYFFISYF
jgi:hypothetical protein